MKNTTFVLLAGCLFFAGCATDKPKPFAERGWIGCEYSLARHQSVLRRLASDTGVRDVSAQSLPPGRKSAIMVTQVATNTPAALAGLETGDQIVELNHHPVNTLSRFRRIIDRTQPGTGLALKLYRDGRFVDCTVSVGREKYRPGGCLTLAFPTVVHPWDLWPNPGFSFVLVGYQPNPGLRHDLVGAAKNSQVYDEEEVVFLGLLEISGGKRVFAQELVPANH